MTIPTSPQNPDANVIGKYFYDGEGKRVKKVTNTETTIFVYNAGGALVAEYSTAAPPPNPTISYLTTDNLGSPRVITDKIGNVISRRDFMPFGEELLAGVGARDTTNLKYTADGRDNVRQRFTGYQKDIETELDFAEARMYQNKHGRFTAPDPLLSSASLDNPQTFNRYVYVGNNPVNLTDPSGLNWCRNDKTGETSFTGQKVACGDGFTSLDGKAGLVKSGGVTATNGEAGAGDVVRLHANGTATILDPANRADVADYARATGAEIQAQSEQILMPNSSIISTTVQGRPTSDYLPPILSPDPDDNPGRDMLEFLSLAPGPLGVPFDITLVAIDISEGDTENAVLSAVGILPFGDALKIGRKLKKVADKLDDLPASRKHGNSLNSEKPQDVYRIDGEDGLHKVGISGGKRRVSDGQPFRATSQASKLTKSTGKVYESRVTKKFPNRRAARDYETKLIRRYSRRFGRPPGNPVDR